MTASISSFADESNSDVLVNSRQKWTLTRPNEEPASLNIALALARDTQRFTAVRHILERRAMSVHDSPYTDFSRYHRTTLRETVDVTRHD